MTEDLGANQRKTERARTLPSRLLLWVLLAVAVSFTGTGLWLLFSFLPAFAVPQSPAVIVMESGRSFAGQYEYLSIHQDGSVLFIQDTGLRIGTPQRSWNKGRISASELDALGESLKKIGFQEMSDAYDLKSAPEGLDVTGSDLYLSLFVNFPGISKHVTASWYVPRPLKEFYDRLREVALNNTREAVRGRPR